MSYLEDSNLSNAWTVPYTPFEPLDYWYIHVLYRCNEESCFPWSLSCMVTFKG